MAFPAFCFGKGTSFIPITFPLASLSSNASSNFSTGIFPIKVFQPTNSHTNSVFIFLPSSGLFV